MQILLIILIVGLLLLVFHLGYKWLFIRAQPRVPYPTRKMQSSDDAWETATLPLRDQDGQSD